MVEPWDSPTLQLIVILFFSITYAVGGVRQRCFALPRDLHHLPFFHSKVSGHGIRHGYSGKLTGVGFAVRERHNVN